MQVLRQQDKGEAKTGCECLGQLYILLPCLFGFELRSSWPAIELITMRILDDPCPLLLWKRSMSIIWMFSTCSAPPKQDQNQTTAARMTTKLLMAMPAMGPAPSDDFVSATVRISVPVVDEDVKGRKRRCEKK